jgi:hypothetical protein
MNRHVIKHLLRRVASALLMGGWWSAAMAAPAEASVPPPTADQIVEKNVAARGGLDAWRKVRSMVWIGHLQSSTSEGAVPFVLQMERPDKTRFEVTIEHEKSIRAFDGAEGWKLKPPRGGSPELAPYTAEEVRFAKDAPGMDGPLIDHEAKGIAVTLDGSDEVDGHKAYRLLVKLPSGTTRHVWIDAATFLEVRYDREVHGTAGPGGTVFVYYGDYKNIDGLQIPMAIETRAADGRPGDRMVIDRALLNPALDESQFMWPGTRHPRASSSGSGAPALGQMAPSRTTRPAPEPAPSDTPASSGSAK